MKKNQQMHLWLNSLFIDHTYIFQSPSATILKVWSIKDYTLRMVAGFVQKTCLNARYETRKIHYIFTEIKIWF
jgi:hypothetical protein